MALIDDFEQIAPSLGGEALEPPVVEEVDRRTGSVPISAVTH